MNRLEDIEKRLNESHTRVVDLIDKVTGIHSFSFPDLQQTESDIACLLELVKVYESALEFYGDLIYAWQAWPITRSDAISAKAREALTQGRKIKGE